MKRRGYIVTGKQMPMFIDGQTGDITRLDMAGFTPSGEWKVGLIFEPKGGHWGLPIGEGVEGLRRLIGQPMRYKNGSPRYYLGDIDHGTRRIQASNPILAVEVGTHG
jgi:hypothetical protein